MPQQHLFSMPKSSAPNPRHRKVTVTTKADGSPLYNLEEVLLSCGVEPNEVVSAFGNLSSASYLMNLERRISGMSAVWVSTRVVLGMVCCWGVGGCLNTWIVE